MLPLGRANWAAGLDDQWEMARFSAFSNIVHLIDYDETNAARFSEISKSTRWPFQCDYLAELWLLEEVALESI